MPYTVLVDDNFHFMDEDERYEHSTHETYEDALQTAKAIVDRDLDWLYPQLVRQRDHLPSAEEFYAYYTGFGEDPFIVGPQTDPPFSAWAYAKERCREICAVGADAAG